MTTQATRLRCPDGARRLDQPLGIDVAHHGQDRCSLPGGDRGSVLQKRAQLEALEQP